jgi:hypothetical protein
MKKGCTHRRGIARAGLVAPLGAVSAVLFALPLASAPRAARRVAIHRVMLPLPGKIDHKIRVLGRAAPDVDARIRRAAPNGGPDPDPRIWRGRDEPERVQIWRLGLRPRPGAPASARPRVPHR